MNVKTVAEDRPAQNPAWPLNLAASRGRRTDPQYGTSVRSPQSHRGKRTYDPSFTKTLRLAKRPGGAKNPLDKHAAINHNYARCPAPVVLPASPQRNRVRCVARRFHGWTRMDFRLRGSMNCQRLFSSRPPAGLPDKPHVGRNLMRRTSAITVAA
jgi:hypothetical protein